MPHRHHRDQAAYWHIHRRDDMLAFDLWLLRRWGLDRPRLQVASFTKEPPYLEWFDVVENEELPPPLLRLGEELVQGLLEALTDAGFRKAETTAELSELRERARGLEEHAGLLERLLLTSTIQRNADPTTAVRVVAETD